MVDISIFPIGRRPSITIVLLRLEPKLSEQVETLDILDLFSYGRILHQPYLVDGSECTFISASVVKVKPLLQISEYENVLIIYFVLLE